MRCAGLVCRLKVVWINGSNVVVAAVDTSLLLPFLDDRLKTLPCSSEVMSRTELEASPPLPLLGPLSVSRVLPTHLFLATVVALPSWAWRAFLSLPTNVVQSAALAALLVERRGRMLFLARCTPDRRLRSDLRSRWPSVTDSSGLQRDPAD